MTQKRKRVATHQVVTLIGLNLVYILIISTRFSYMGFNLDWNVFRYITGMALLFMFLFLGFYVKNTFLYAVWNIIYTIFLSGEIIYYQLSGNGNIEQIISISLVLLVILLFSQLGSFSLKPISVNQSSLLKKLEIISFLLFLPYPILYNQYIRVENLWLKNVYLTRSLFRQVAKPFTGYLTAPLVRVLLPIVIVENLEEKKWIKVFVFSSMLVYVYLCGALKSIFIGFFSVLLFYRGDYYDKILLFLKAIIFSTFFGTLFWIITDNVFFVDSFIRRVFFVPPLINRYYLDYFSIHPTYLSHTPFGLGIEPYRYDKFLPMFVGENLMGLPGMNANVGMFTEGFISYGYFGSIVFSLIISYLFYYFSATRFPSKYFGIIFVYIYYINTAFFSTLLLTHGLLFLMVISFIISKVKVDVSDV